CTSLRSFLALPRRLLCDSLSPYTTLFRSWLIRNLYFSATYLLNSIGNKAVDLPSNLFQPMPAFITVAIYTLTFLWLAIWLYRRQDRKSTRLNSSHVKISYAVFCLKKQTKN